MKKIGFLLFLTGILCFGTFALRVSAQEADTSFTVDESAFITVGSKEDSIANKIEADTAAKADTVSTATSATGSPKAENKQQALTRWQTFIKGLVGGFLAFLMPCIFPMVPLTVSFFMKKGGSRKKGIVQAMIYGLSIIVIYVAVGLLITVLFGSAKLNELSSSGTFNLLFFVLLVVFAISFFGAFEITLPSSLVNKIDRKADTTGGLGGLFFMAASLALVSFSCTGPIIGTLLVDASSKGEILGPAIGMFGFALALALPFTLSAIFPGFLNSMPKSGGWLNSLKVCLGFLELALALKFLSSADLVWHLHWFDREVFLVLWIVIFALMGFYLLGKLRLSHDTDLPFINVPRLLLAMVSFAFAVYMVPGLWGAPVNILSGIAPPMHTQDFILSAGQQAPASAGSTAFPAKVKHSEVLTPPRGFKAFFDLDEAVAYARAVDKPLMLDFTGWSCVNCRRMEESIWVKPSITKLINEEYVLVQLYVDERRIKMPADKVHYSKYLKGETDDLGRWNQDLQATRYGANSQPFYVLADHELNALVPPQGAIFDEKEYGAFLQTGIDQYKANKK